MSKKKIKVYVRFYASRIKHGLMALDEVPEKYRTAVEEFMNTDEYLMMQIDNKKAVLITKKGYSDNKKRGLFPLFLYYAEEIIFLKGRRLLKWTAHLQQERSF